MLDWICRAVLLLVVLVAMYQTFYELRKHREGMAIVCLCTTLIAFVAFALSFM